MDYASKEEVVELIDLMLSDHDSGNIELKRSLLEIFPFIDWKDFEVPRDHEEVTPLNSELMIRSIIGNLINDLPIQVQFSEHTTDKQHKEAKKNVVWRCSICGKVLMDKHGVRKHEDRVHFNIRNFGCEFCPKRFSLKTDLLDHVRAVHEKIKSFICDICGIALATRYSLRTHKLIHEEGSKSISCSQCSKKFRHMNTFRKHIARVHEFNPEKRLKCEHCEKLFNHKEGLNRHVKKFHSSLAPEFWCDLCFSGFAFKYELNRHRRRVHQQMGQNNVQGLFH